MQQIIDQVLKFDGLLATNSTAILTVLGVLFSLSKMVSTEKAPAVVGKIQLAFDSLAKVLTGAGVIIQKLADALSQVVKSDGVLGKK